MVEFSYLINTFVTGGGQKKTIKAAGEMRHLPLTEADALLSTKIKQAAPRYDSNRLKIYYFQGEEFL